MCGAISFEVSGELKRPDACHCSQCRKFSGHYFVSTDVPRDAVRITGGENITWFPSSERVRRGFCSICGCSLFFDPPAKDWIGVAMGAFDGPSETSIELHVFAAEKGDYYEIVDGLPQYEQLPLPAAGEPQ
ncbi:MAG TPA: GFA family protein [Lysobacter sp.]|nr:GFA family protein [Lysobacter sp.]